MLALWGYLWGGCRACKGQHLLQGSFSAACVFWNVAAGARQSCQQVAAFTCH